MWKIRRNRKSSARKIIPVKILHLNFYMLIYVLKMCLRSGTDEIFIRMGDKVPSPHSHGIRYIGRAAPLWKKIARKKSWDARRDSDENEKRNLIKPSGFLTLKNEARQGRVMEKCAKEHILEVVPFFCSSKKDQWSRCSRRTFWEPEEIWTGCRKGPLLMVEK